MFYRAGVVGDGYFVIPVAVDLDSEGAVRAESKGTEGRTGDMKQVTGGLPVEV
jgi:hypothetical protein